MQIPHELQNGIEALLEGARLRELSQDFEVIRERYKSEKGSGECVRTQQEVQAYVATRMPSIYVVLDGIFSELRERYPGFTPDGLIDFGSGPGTVLWAATATWATISDAKLFDASELFRQVGRYLHERSSLAPGCKVEWVAVDFNLSGVPAVQAPLVVSSYVLGELSEQGQRLLVDRAWNSTTSLLVLVEPGTPAGFQRILYARDRLIHLGAAIVAPCPGNFSCPAASGSWCHFSQRVERIRAQRLGKSASLAFEDEKFSYLVASRNVETQAFSRVVDKPVVFKHEVRLPLCTPRGQLEKRGISRSDKESYRLAKRLRWGERVKE